MRPFVVVGPLALLFLTSSIAESLAQTSMCALGDFQDASGSTLMSAGSQSRVHAYTAAELVAGMVNHNVQHIIIMKDVDFSTAKWESYALPIVIKRNVTVSGAFADEKRWPVVDMAYVNAVFRLGPGVVICMSQMVLRGFREGPIWQSSGMDFLALPASDTPLAAELLAENVATVSNGMVDAATAMFTNGALVYRACLPDAWGSAPSNALPRPSRFPGKQSEQVLPPKAAGTCDNTTTDPLKKGMDYCWPGWGFDTDLALHAWDIDSFDKQVFRDYFIRLKSVYYLCDMVMPEDCTRNYNPVGCFRHLVPKVTPGTTPSQTSLPPPETSPAEESTRATKDPSGGDLSTDAGSGGGSGGGAGGAHVGVMGAAIGGAVAGVVLVAVALAVILVRRRRRLRRLGSEEAKAVAGGPSCPPGCNDGTYKLATSARFPPDAVSIPPLQDSFFSTSLPSGARSSLPRLTVDEVTLVPVTEHTPMEPSLDLSVKLRKSRPGSRRLANQTSCSTYPDGAEDDAGAVFVNSGKGKGSDHGFGDGGGKGGEAADGGSSAVVSGYSKEADAAAKGEGEATGFGPEVTLLPTVLGAGAFGKVMVGMYQGSRVAVKMLKRDMLSLGDSNKSSGAIIREEFMPASDVAREQEKAFTHERKALEQEVEVLARCRHPNIVRLLAASLDAARVCLVMELMDTSLERLLYNHYKGNMPLPLVLHIGMQIARALAYLHPTILHRDLKPANVLISQPDSHKPVAKLADFGLSRLLSSVLVTKHPVTGTAPYMAPETFNTMTKAITDRTDIYSLGVILFELLAGMPPWHGLGMLQIASALLIHNAKLPLHALPNDRCPIKLRAVIWSCWEMDPLRRPAAAEIMKALVLMQEELGYL